MTRWRWCTERFALTQNRPVDVISLPFPPSEDSNYRRNDPSTILWMHAVPYCVRHGVICLLLSHRHSDDSESRPPARKGPRHQHRTLAFKLQYSAKGGNSPTATPLFPLGFLSGLPSVLPCASAREFSNFKIPLGTEPKMGTEPRLRFRDQNSMRRDFLISGGNLVVFPSTVSLTQDTHNVPATSLCTTALTSHVFLPCLSSLETSQEVYAPLAGDNLSFFSFF